VQPGEVAQGRREQHRHRLDGGATYRQRKRLSIAR
jgi:hypothetical protein